MRRESLLIGLAVLIVVLLIGAAAVILSLTMPGDVPPVSNPGNGIEGTLQTPPPRYDWADE